MWHDLGSYQYLLKPEIPGKFWKQFKWLLPEQERVYVPKKTRCETNRFTSKAGNYLEYQLGTVLTN